MKVIKSCCILLLIMVMLCFTGCWNYRELDGLTMVSGFAIDKGEQGHKYHLTFELLNLSENKSAAELLESDGDTIFDAVRNAIAKTQKKLFFSDCKVIVINQDIAAEGIAPLLDWITRDAELRLTLNPIISKEKTAGEILRPKPVTDTLQALEISKTLQLNSDHLLKSPKVELYEAIDMLGGDGTSLILPAIKVTDSRNGKVTELDGAAVFKKDKLVGYLNSDESKIFLFLKNQINDSLFLTNLDSKDKNAALEIISSQTKVTPAISNGSVTMHIEITAQAALAENLTNKDYLTEDGLKEVEKSADATIQADVSDLIKKVQKEYKSDIFGFGASISRSMPDWWKKNKSSWDESFPSLKYTISADMKIKNTATAQTIVKIGD